MLPNLSKLPICTGVPDPNSFSWGKLWEDAFSGTLGVDAVINELANEQKAKNAQDPQGDPDAESDPEEYTEILGQGFYGVPLGPGASGVWAEALKQLREQRIELDEEQANDKKNLMNGAKLSIEIIQELNDNIEMRKARLDLVHELIARITSNVRMVGE